jgi:hypothetical protein
VFYSVIHQILLDAQDIDSDSEEHEEAASGFSHKTIQTCCANIASIVSIEASSKVASGNLRKLVIGIKTSLAIFEGAK